MTDVSVIGLGVMGSALARTLIAGGMSVTVWNRTADKADSLVAAGAARAESAAAAIAASPATITCIASHQQTIDLLTGKEAKEIARILKGSQVTVEYEPVKNYSIDEWYISVRRRKGK